MVSPIAVAVSTVGEMPTQRTDACASASVATESTPSNLALIEWVYDRIDTNPAPAEIRPAPQRHALLIKPCGRSARVSSGFDPATGSRLLHPVTERHPFLSCHLSVPVGFGKLRTGYC